ncbi:MAG: hypothetical protein JNM93_03140 [Bacteriovoracaceae bacterium]|nr:hypothetical protein [Bacteriovoracaceae bacterium]
MIGRLLRLAIKILPLITIYKGITSGGARLKPFIDMGKVALTQYEVAEITKLVVSDYKSSNGLLVSPQDFSYFVKDQFNSQYSILAREIRGDRSHNMSVDIWGNAFMLMPNSDVSNVKIVSSGPDLTYDTKDDIAMDFNINRRGPASANNEMEQNDYPTDQNAGDFDEEGFDVDGFNRAGYDRDGYDRNGIHQSEKEMSQNDY